MQTTNTISQSIYSNYNLAKDITKSITESKDIEELRTKCSHTASKTNQKVEETCFNKEFIINLTAYLINELIKRGFGKLRSDERARALIIGKVPGFIEKVSSLDYLRSFAVTYFKDHPNKYKILQIFKKSLFDREFEEDLCSAIDVFKAAQVNQGSFYSAEESLRKPLTIFNQSNTLIPKKIAENRLFKKPNKF